MELVLFSSKQNMSVASVSIYTLTIFLSKASCRPVLRAKSSMQAGVQAMADFQYPKIRCPWLFLKIPPMPPFLYFPLKAPSMLSFIEKFVWGKPFDRDGGSWRYEVWGVGIILKFFTALNYHIKRQLVAFIVKRVIISI